MNQTEKVFIGNVKPGKFHEGQAHLKVKISGKDIAKLIEIGKAKGPGTWQTHDNQTGEEMNFVCLEIKTSQSGKTYMELDTWKPAPAYQGNANASAAIPVQQAEVVGDLPF